MVGVHNRCGDRGQGDVQRQRGARRDGRGAGVQGVAADEPDGLEAAAGWLREAGAGDAELLRAVPEDLRRRPDPEELQGVQAVVGGFGAE